MFFKSRAKTVKLDFSAISEAIIDSLGFSFAIESLGKESREGFVVAVSGDAVDKGELTLKELELHRLVGGKFEIDSYPFKKVAKKEGGYAYQAQFKGFYIPPVTPVKSMPTVKFETPNEEEMMDKIAKEVQFKFIASYSGKTDSEALVAVFPYENLIEGGCSEWVTVTAGKNYYLNMLINQG